MTTYHILNGDCLADQLRQTKINQNFIICRECLVEGDVCVGNITDFWTIRAKFIADTYKASVEEYFSKTVNEFEKLNSLTANSEICLWFENDLFCQVNMWFVISILADYPDLRVFRIFPITESNTDKWKGFGIANAEKLEQAYYSKVRFTLKDIRLGKDLWTSYQNGDLKHLKELSEQQSGCFKYLEEVCQAHIDRFPLDNSLGRPDKVVKEIINANSVGLQTVISEFTDREGIYGFGDLQIKNIYDRQLQNQ